MGTVSGALKWSMAIAAVGFLASLGLFFRMAAAVNKKLPTERRIPLIEFRYHMTEIKRLYEDMFPESSMATVWFLLQLASALVAAIGIVLEIAR